MAQGFAAWLSSAEAQATLTEAAEYLSASLKLTARPAADGAASYELLLTVEAVLPRLALATLAPALAGLSGSSPARSLPPCCLCHGAGAGGALAIEGPPAGTAAPVVCGFRLHNAWGPMDTEAVQATEVAEAAALRAAVDDFWVMETAPDSGTGTSAGLVRLGAYLTGRVGGYREASVSFELRNERDGARPVPSPSRQRRGGWRLCRVLRAAAACD